MQKKALTVDVWSDIVCPWCAIGKRRLEAALAKFPHRDDVEVVWRAFELDPSAPPVRSEDNVARLAEKYGRSKAEAEAMLANVTDVAARDGLDFQLARARSGNTFDGHRLLHLALERGVQGAVKERLLRAYMTEGEAVGDRDVLVRLASEAGLDAAEARAVLETDRYAFAGCRSSCSARSTPSRARNPPRCFWARWSVRGTTCPRSTRTRRKAQPAVQAAAARASLVTKPTGPTGSASSSCTRRTRRDASRGSALPRGCARRGASTRTG
jgi:predicted DsbA family dithiol-disulfide isomerase